MSDDAFETIDSPVEEIPSSTILNAAHKEETRGLYGWITSFFTQEEQSKLINITAPCSGRVLVTDVTIKSQKGHLEKYKKVFMKLTKPVPLRSSLDFDTDFLFLIVLHDHPVIFIIFAARFVPVRESRTSQWGIVRLIRLEIIIVDH